MNFLTNVGQSAELKKLHTLFGEFFLFFILFPTNATMFFKPGFFEAALGVNLTTMLVMTTIIINVRQILPTTSYLKMFDIWLIICQLIPFIEVCINICVPVCFHFYI